ncbi:multidrug transporter [Marinobacteraceae bacterium S3BR75-40.1]
MVDFESAVILLFVLAGCFALAGLLFFLRPRWFMAWLKGSAAFLLLFMAGSLAVLALNLRAYHALTDLETIAQLHAKKLGPQHWQVVLAEEEGAAHRFELRGDQWQLDARLLRFNGPLRWLGLKPAYRLDRLAGRYISLEQEQTGERTVHSLSPEPWVDIWSLDRKWGLPLLESQYGNATFMPLRNDALYDVRLGDTGLVAVPMNDAARQAVQSWD